MQRTILFEHIPKTGGITLRGILQKLYGEKRIFFINSKYPRISLDEFSNMDNNREQYRVIAGHGALMYMPFLKDPFTVTILRHPVSLFFSQFHYLKITERNRYWKDVRKMDSAEEYLEYALSMGHDNLMTRFLANSMDWTVDPEKSFHKMEKSGGELLQKAKTNLSNFDAVIHLDRFDAGVFALSRKLGWNRIPLYKPSNRTPKKPAKEAPDTGFMEKLRHALRFDIELYDFSLSKSLDISRTVDIKKPAYRIFSFRQQMVKKAAILLERN